MTGKKVTLKVLSTRTGFDKSTISRVLRGDTTLSIRPENLELIKRVADELGYVPDVAGRSLRLARSYSLGVMVPSLQNQIHAQIVEGAHEACMASGYSLIIAHAKSADKQPEVIDQLIRKNRVDGLLALTFRNEMAQVPALKRTGVPVVAVNWKSDEFENSVVVDDRVGAAKATRCLIELGHRRIAHLSGDAHRFNASERLLGYQEALAEAGIPFDPNLVSEAGYDFDDGVRGMNNLLRHRGKFTAVFVVSLLTAAGALSALRKAEISVPDEVSAIGFHDGMLAQVLTPTLSTVSYPLTEMGRYAAANMIELIEGRRQSFSKIFSDAQVIQRESTKAIT